MVSVYSRIGKSLYYVDVYVSVSVCVWSKVMRILPSSISTTFLNSGTNGLSMSSMMALRAFRSLASDFFIIVPLSSPALKLPVGGDKTLFK